MTHRVTLWSKSAVVTDCELSCDGQLSDAEGNFALQE